MTREEAIEVLKLNYPSTCFHDLCEAVDIAIQALSAQPSATDTNVGGNLIDIREQLDNAYAHGYTAAESEYRAILDTMPKVVRCKDCNEYQDNFHWCKLHDVEMQPMDFCSYGERKNAAD